MTSLMKPLSVHPVPGHGAEDVVVSDDGLVWTGTEGTVEQVLDGLAFAHGVALSADGSYVAVAETGARNVVRR